MITVGKKDIMHKTNEQGFYNIPWIQGLTDAVAQSLQDAHH